MQFARKLTVLLALLLLAGLVHAQEDVWDIEFVKTFKYDEEGALIESANFTTDDLLTVVVTIDYKPEGSDSGNLNWEIVNSENKELLEGSTGSRPVSGDGDYEFAISLDTASSVSHAVKVSVDVQDGEYAGNNSGVAYISVLEQKPAPTSVDELPLVFVALTALVVVIIIHKRE